MVSHSDKTIKLRDKLRIKVNELSNKRDCLRRMNRNDLTVFNRKTEKPFHFKEKNKRQKKQKTKKQKTKKKTKK